MTRPSVEVADILRVQGDCFREQNRSWLGYQQLSVLRAITACRMAIFSDLRNPWKPYRTLSGPQTSALQTFARGSLRVQKRQGSKRPFFELRTQGLISSASVANRGKGPAISRTVGRCELSLTTTARWSVERMSPLRTSMVL